MKVLGISGSPRIGGNTEYAVRHVIDAIRSRLPKVEVEFLRITDYKIEHCRGCRYCMKATECVIKGDDLMLLVHKMLSADLIIIGAPIYWYGPPGVLKDFIDRTHGFYPDNKRFAGKKVALISVAATSGYPSHERTMGWLEYYGAEYVAKVRLEAREIDELKDKTNQIRKLENLQNSLVARLSR
jgi:multimeric flavodoxin WrbA